MSFSTNINEIITDNELRICSCCGLAGDVMPLDDLLGYVCAPCFEKGKRCAEKGCNLPAISVMYVKFSARKKRVCRVHFIDDDYELEQIGE